MKKTLFLMILFILAAFLFANGKQEPVTNASAQDDVSTTYTISYTVGFWGTEMDPENYFANTLNEKFNVDMQMDYIPQKTLNQKYAVIVASGDMPDVMISQGSGDWRTWCQQGAFLALDDYLPDYPNLMKNVTPSVLERSVMVDGKIYGYPNPASEISRVLGYRKDWADKLGLDAPETLDDLFQMFEAFTYQDPDGNGKDDTYGFGLHNTLEAVNDMILPSFGTKIGNKGSICAGSENGVVELGFLQPGVKDYLVFLNKCWEAGVIEPSSLTLNSVKSLWQSGTIGFYRLQPTYINQDLTTMHDIDPNAEIAWVDPVKVQGYEPFIIKGNGWFRMHQIANTVNDTGKVRRILSILDWVVSDGYNLITRGVKDVHWTEENGKLVQLQAFKDQGWMNFYSFAGRRGPEYNFDPFTAQGETAKLGTAAIESYQKFAVDPIVILPPPEAAENGADMEKIRLETMFKIIVGELPLDALEETQQEWMRRGGELYLKQVRGN
jgi:putative aldouronate transport system substrate-binding protein